MACYEVDFTKKQLTYYRGKSLQIVYGTSEDEQTKYHPDVATDDVECLQDLIVKYFTIDEYKKYIFISFRSVPDDEWEKMLDKLSERILKQMTVEEIAVLPGKHPRIRELTESEGQRLTEEEGRAYDAACQRFRTVFWK